jgi:nucleoid-associated protein YgaU
VSRGNADHGAPQAAPMHYRPSSVRQLGRRADRRLRRRRLAGIVRFTVFLLLIFIAVWTGVRVAHAGPDASIYRGQRYVVRSGDTLWTIAAHEYGEGIDLRRAVYDIRHASGLETSAITPGETLTLPYEGQ